MGGFSVWHWLIVGILVLLLFGKGRFSDMMGDVAKGIKSFKKGMSDDEESEAERKAEAQRRLTADRPLDRSIDLPPEPSRAADPLDRREP